MNRYFRIFLLFIIILASQFNTSAQVFDINAFGGLSYNKFLIEKNIISETRFIREGIGKAGLFIGMSYSIGPPKVQPKKGLEIKSRLLFEASYGKGGSSLTSTYTQGNGRKTISKVDYTFYRGDYSAKLALNLKNFQFVVGPTVSNIFYAGMDIEGLDKTRSATGDFASIIVGYELGAGIEMNATSLSLRYQRNASEFAQQIFATPAKINNYQIRVILAYRIFRKEKGINWRSVNWHK